MNAEAYSEAATSLAHPSVPSVVPYPSLTAFWVFSASFTSYGYFPSPAGAALASNGTAERPNGTTYYQEYSAGAVPAAGPVSLSTPSRTENHVSQSPLHRDNPYSTRTGQFPPRHRDNPYSTRTGQFPPPAPG